MLPAVAVKDAERAVISMPGSWASMIDPPAMSVTPPEPIELVIEPAASNVMSLPLVEVTTTSEPVPPAVSGPAICTPGEVI